MTKKAVMLAIRPEWCRRIISGEKTIEFRKSAPDIETPFKCYIYETKGVLSTPWMDEDGHRIWHGLGMVIGEFTCVGMESFSVPFPAYMNEMSDADRKFLADACLTYMDVHHYLGHRTGYGWRIADVKAYADPKPITEFKRWNRTEENAPCAHTKSLYEPCETCRECNLKRPPQSYVFVEERGEES